MHVLDLFNDKDRNYLNGGASVSEGGMPDLNLEYEDYLKLPPMAFQSRYKMSKEAWAEKYKNLLPKPAPVDPLAGMPEAPLEEGDVVQMPARTGTSTPQANPAEVIPMIKDRTDRAYAMWKQRVLQAFPDNAGQIKFYSKGNDVVARLPGANDNLGIFNIDSHKGTVLNEVDPNNFDSDWDYQDAVAKSGQPRSSYRSQEDDTFDADVAYSKKMYQLSQQQKRDADHDRLATGTNEGSQQVDSLVIDALKIMRGSELNDAVLALKTVLGDREYNSRRGFYSFYVKQLLGMYGQQGMAEGDVEEGLGSKLAGLGLAGAMALGSAGANARVTPDGQGGYTGGLKPTPTVTQPATNTAPARIDSPSGPSGFSKEYLQKAADPNRTGRYLISVEKAQQLLKQTQEGVAEGTDIDARISNLKDAIRFETPRSVPGEDHREQYARHAEKIAGYKAELKKLVAQKKQQGVVEADMSRRGFLKGIGAAAVAGVGASGQAQTDQRYDLGNSFVTASATIDGVTYRAIQDTISKSGYMLNQRSDGTPIVNRPGEFLVIRNSKIEARPSLAPNIVRALQKAGILPDDGEMQSQTEPAVTHSSRGGTNQPAVTHSSRGGTNQPAVTYSSSGKRMRNEETTSRIKMDDYLKAAEDLQNRLTQAIRQGDKELIKKLSKDRDDLDARVRQHGMIPEASASASNKHRISLTVTDPNHPMVSKRKETIQKSVRIPATRADGSAISADDAVKMAVKHHKKKGYRVHSAEHLETIGEEKKDVTTPSVQFVLVVNGEPKFKFSTRQQAQQVLNDFKAEFPNVNAKIEPRVLPKAMYEGDMQSLLASYKNLIKRAIAIIFGKKQPTNDPAAFQRMMNKIVAPADSSRYQALWQEYKNDKHYYVPTPHPFKDINNKEKMYLWANSLSQFVSDKYSDAPIETLVHLVAGLTEIAVKEALKQSRSGLDEAAQQKPRVRKYTKMRPDGSKAVRYEVLDHMGRRITGQGPEGFDDLKNAKDFYYKNYDRLSSLDETADGNITDTVKMDVPLLIRIMEFSREDAKTDMELHDVVERLIELGKTGDTLTMQDYQDAVASVSAPETPSTPAEPEPVKEAGGRYWCSTDKRWKDR